MNNASIRWANNNDLDVLITLYEEFHMFHVQGVPDRLRQPELAPDSATEARELDELRETLRMLIHRDDVAIFVAQVEDKVVGLAEVYLREDESHPLTIAHRYGLLQSLIVSATYRKYGLGRLLVEAAQQWAKGKGATEMQLDIWEFEAGPLHFYEHLGYRTLKRHMVSAL